MSSTSAVLTKIGRRVAAAERRVERRNARAKLDEQTTQKRETRESVIPAVQASGQQLREAIIARHQAWELGPLAPRRDTWARDHSVRSHAGSNPYWGSLSFDQMSNRVSLTEKQLNARCAWAGGPKTFCLKQGDRVAVIEGPWRGQVGKVEEIKLESGLLSIEGLRSNVTLPSFIRGEDQSRPVVATPSQVPISAVRLVHPLRDETTGVYRDVLIRELRPGPVFTDRPTRRRVFSRWVPGLNVKIPWPSSATEGEDGQPQSKTAPTHPIDTRRMEVEERTFVPTLLRAPVPDGVIDELRNRFSRFRTRHSDEYIAAQAARVDADKARRSMVESMRTPLQEFHALRRVERRARGQPKLDQGMLAAIGRVIANNKKSALQAAGLDEVAVNVQVSAGEGSGAGAAAEAPSKEEEKTTQQAADAKRTPPPSS